MRLAILAVLLGAVSSVAVASTPWVDDKGRQMTMQMPGDSPTLLHAAGHDAAAAANLFKAACLDTRLERQPAGQTAENSGWGFAYRPVMVPFKTPVDMGGWYASDAVVNVGAEMFFNKHRQCNLIIAPSGDTSYAAVKDALVAALGQTPTNAAEAFDKKGKPRKWFQPEWNLALSSGDAALVKLMPVVGASGTYQFTALQKVSK
jgi:hypothetical protein